MPGGRGIAHSTASRWQGRVVRNSDEYDLGDLGDLELEGIYRDQQYPNRMVEVEDGEGDEIEVPRHDKRKEVGLTWLFPLIDRALDLGVGYRFETRDSNDKGNDYSAHTVSAVLSYTF